MTKQEVIQKAWGEIWNVFIHIIFFNCLIKTPTRKPGKTNNHVTVRCQLSCESS